MSFHVQFAGSKYAVSAAPTAPLSTLVEQVCKQLKTPVDPATCTLKHGKSTLQLGDPIRFANLPRGATLVMESSQPSAPRLGFADSTPAPLPSISESQAHEPPASRQGHRTVPQRSTNAAQNVEVPAAALSNEPPAAPVAAEPASTAASTRLSAEAGAPRAATVDAVEPSRPLPSEPVRGVDPQQGGSAADHKASGATDTVAREALAREMPAEASTSQPSAPALGFHSELGMRPTMSAAQLVADAQSRKFAVFSVAALAAELKASGMDDDLPDEFYELTAADVQHEIAAMRRKQQHQEAGLRTKARRELESAQKAAAIGHATIRLFLPYGMVVQADFSPSDRMAQLRAFVQHAVLTPEFSERFHLFTTPPKVVLGAKVDTKTFWEMGMVPGANVHVGIEHQDFEGSLAVQQPCQPEVYKAFIRSEVLSREGPVPKEMPASAAKRAAEQDSPARRLAGDEFRTAGSTKVAASGGKVPKWLKLGK